MSLSFTLLSSPCNEAMTLSFSGSAASLKFFSASAILLSSASFSAASFLISALPAESFSAAASFLLNVLFSVSSLSYFVLGDGGLLEVAICALSSLFSLFTRSISPEFSLIFLVRLRAVSRASARSLRSVSRPLRMESLSTMYLEARSSLAKRRSFSSCRTSLSALASLSSLKMPAARLAYCSRMSAMELPSFFRNPSRY